MTQMLHQHIEPGVPTAQPNFRRFHKRHMLFKIGVIGLVLSTVIFILGLSNVDMMFNGHLTMFVWYGCFRFLECLALFFLLLSLTIETYQDFFKRPVPPENNAVEAIAGFAGISGLIAAAIFGVKIHITNSRSYISQGIIVGLILTVLSSLLVIMCAVLVAVSRATHAFQTKAALMSAMYPAPHQIGVAVTEQTAHFMPIPAPYADVPSGYYYDPSSRPAQAYLYTTMS